MKSSAKIASNVTSVIQVYVLALALILISGSKALAGGQNKGHDEHGNFIIFPNKVADPELSKQPGKAQLTTPAYYAKITGNQVKLEWTAAVDAEHYHVQVATDPAFKWLVANEYNVKATSFDVANLEPGNHYYWRVVGVRPQNKEGHTKGYWAVSMFETTGTATK